jgi:hypothetical protein
VGSAVPDCAWSYPVEVRGDVISCLVQQAGDPGRLVADDPHVGHGLLKARVRGTSRSLGVLIMAMLGIGLGSHRDHRGGSEALA